MSEHPSDSIHRPEVWSGVAAGYETTVMPIMRPFAVTTLDLLGLTPAPSAPVRLLDVAAGTGVVAAEAARRGAEVVATDFAPGMVEAMRRRFAAEGLPVRTEVMDGQALDLDDASFDLATSTFGLIFFIDPLAGLRELHRVLCPGGRVGIASWDLAGAGLPQLVGEALARVIPDLPPPPAPPWAPLGQQAGLEQAVRAAGFHDVVAHHVVHHFDVPDAVAFFHELPNWTPPLRPLFTRLRAEQIDVAANEFRRVIREHTTRDGVPQAALIGIATA